MSINIAADDFEDYRLDVEFGDKCTLQRFRGSPSGANTWQTWSRARSLGQGAFGEVWQERWEDEHGDWHYRAVKICSEQKNASSSNRLPERIVSSSSFFEVGGKEEPQPLPSELTKHSIPVLLLTYMDGGWTQTTFSWRWSTLDTAIYPTTPVLSSWKWRSKRLPITFCGDSKLCMRRVSRIAI